MQPLEITDQYGRKIHLMSFKWKVSIIDIQNENKLTDPLIGLCSVSINKESAIQIINHLKQCFNI